MREKLTKISVAILGATGEVGQRFVQLLAGHPWFNLELLAASGKSAGNKYSDIVNWRFGPELPGDIGEKKIVGIDPETFKTEGIELIFSALPADVAIEVEADLAAKGFKVFSNASSHRMAQNVPILIADINPEHLALVEQQQKAGAGYIVTNPNCTVAGLATGLKPLTHNFSVTGVNVATYQALSGAGYPGVPSMDITGNIIPYIQGEEPKVEAECKKILGDLTEEGIKPAAFEIIASCARVPVRDGHLEAVLVDLASEVTLEEVKHAFSGYNSQKPGTLPTVPDNPVIVTDEPNRPQPIIDVDNGAPSAARGMAVTIGRLKIIGNKLRFFLLVHNTIRGAAGCSIMNAELAKTKGYL